MNQRYNITYYTNGFQEHAQSESKPEYNHPYYTDVPSGKHMVTTNTKGSSIKSCNFADYIEGIYVGYKWFETADAEGFWDQEPYNGYENVVAFPFGHGLSYTSFEWEIEDSHPVKNAEIKKADEEFYIDVKVTNTGDVAGKDVIEAYLTAPYYRGEIEKSAVKLVGFIKTPIIQPGKSQSIRLALDPYEFLSYDCYDKNHNGHTGYELDRGNYEIRLMENSHTDKAGNNKLPFKVPQTLYVDEDPVTGAPVKNLFTGEDAVDGYSVDGETLDQNIGYITREDFAPLPTETLPDRPWNENIPDRWHDEQDAEWNAQTVDPFGKEIPDYMPTWGEANGIKVMNSNGTLTEEGMQMASDYDDPLWDSALNQTTMAESLQIYKDHSYNRSGCKSVGLKSGTKSDFRDSEGASQVGGGVAYPTPTVTCQTWNQNIYYSFGISEAKDMAANNVDALYGPASNIHRSPYGGRNSGYHSEDGFLSGMTLSNISRGLEDGGKQGFLKHFAVNDTEFHRVGLYTWLTEQALREIYLKPFEMAVKQGNATAIMTSFNRVGAVWAGGSEALCVGVLRNEWGFRGQIITDYHTENETFMNKHQHFHAGCNYVLAGSSGGIGNPDTTSPRVQWQLRENLHQIIYGNIRPLYHNAQYNENPSAGSAIVVTNSKKAWVWWKPALTGIEITAISGLAYASLACFLLMKPKAGKEGE